MELKSGTFNCKGGLPWVWVVLGFFLLKINRSQKQ